MPPKIDVSRSWSPPVNITTSASRNRCKTSGSVACSLFSMWSTSTLVAFRYCNAFTYSGPTSLGIFDAVVTTSILDFSLCFDSISSLFNIPVSKKFKLLATLASKPASVKLPLSTAPPIIINFPFIFISNGM
ncbi:hypothetical protein D3C86_1122910 [compost metagenome]